MNHDDQVEMTLSEFLANRPREVSDLAIEVRRMIVKLAPNSSELLYNSYAVSDVFTYTTKLGQAFIHIATYAEHVNLGFNHGTRLDDPDEILQGSGKLIRHIRIGSIEMTRKKNVKQLILAAIELGREMAENAGGIKPQLHAVKTK